MPNNRHPSYREHKVTGQAVVTLHGKDFYLGRHGTKESKAELDRLIAEWLANWRHLAISGPMTVAEVVSRFCPWFGFPSSSDCGRKKRLI